jgi:hypothetical protein
MKPQQLPDEFYVGYQPQAPAAIAHRIRRIVAALAILAVSLAVAFVLGQASFANSRFEFGNDQTYEGTLYAWPYPMLVTNGRHYLLVNPGKHGVSAEGLDGRLVGLRGALIARGRDRMLEIEAGSLQILGKAQTADAAVNMGTVTLAGEIVDTKCHFGVMNPGEGKVHRDCAVRCISGGIPPGFWVHDADGMSRVLLLVGSDGRALGREILDYVAEPLHIRGQLARTGTAWVLKAEPKDFQRD